MALEVKCQESYLFSKRCPAHCISWVLPKTSSYHHLYVQYWWLGECLRTGCRNITAMHFSWGCPASKAKASLIQATVGCRNREQGGLTAGWKVKAKSVQQSLGWRPGSICVPQRSLLGKYCSNTSIYVVQSAPSAILLMTQVEGGADTLVGCAG